MQPKYRAIAVSGESASGKSTTCRLLAATLDWERINTGDRFRQFARERGLPVEKSPTLPDEVHKEFDALQKEILQNSRDVIVEGRLAGWLSQDMPDVFKVLCAAPLEIRVQRFIEREGGTPQAALAKINLRDEADRQKYQKVYGLEDYRAPQFYNLVLDTGASSPEQIVQQIMAKLAAE